MTHTFNILAQLTVEHGYYNRNPFQGFRYLPTAPTMHFMGRNDLMLVQNHGRTQIVVSSVRNTDGIDIHSSVNRPFSLLFCVENTEIHLENISGLPARTATQSLLFSNVWNEGPQPDRWPAGPVVEWAGNTFRLPKSEWDGSLPVDSFGQPVAATPAEQDDTVSINASVLDEGVYRWQTGNGVRYFCNVDLGFRAKPFALLHIATHDTLLNGNRLLSPTYRIAIPTVEAFWEYRLPEMAVKKYGIENLSVDVNDRSVEFIRRPPDEEQPYLSFTSSVPIRLEDRKEVRFRLKRTNTNGAQDTILLADLPFPSPATFPYKENGRITSPIFVYV